MGEKAKRLPDFSDTILEKTKNLLLDKESYERFTSRGNTKREFEYRINAMKDIYSSVL
jgi:hypothetical protein